MQNESEEAGRNAVRQLLLARLDQAGMVRARAVTAEAHTAMRERLVDHLVYMDPRNLRTLADVLMDHGQGPSRSWWPAEVTVRVLAHGLQVPPPSQRRILQSWLASVEGPKAELGGYLVELFRWLAYSRIERPPLPLEMQAIRHDAVATMRELAMMRARLARGMAQARDAEEVAAYERDQARARAIVAAGAAGRSDRVCSGEPAGTWRWGG